jgi:shikimate dehydrogenase
VSLAGKDIQDLIDRFEATEGAVLPETDLRTPCLAAIGSVAVKALSSPALKKQLSEDSVEPKEFRPLPGVEDLALQRDWSLALVLSPHKRSVQTICDVLTPCSERTGVIDTLLQDGSGTLFGVNTNVFGAARAIEHLMGGSRPERSLILGTGASARSCAMALLDLYGTPEIGVIGRNPDRTFLIAEEFPLAAVQNPKDYAPDLIINATTVGETGDGELIFPLEDVLVAGTRFFDLNNRTSELQKTALAAGCVTASGVIMQLSVNALRVHLLRRGRIDQCSPI